jgi:hypothetical protein
MQNTKHTVCNTLRYRIPSILYEIHYGTEYQAYCMQYTTVQNTKHTLGILYRSVLHTVCLVFCTVVYCLICLVFCNVVYFIQYIHYVTEYQAYCMQYTTVQNAKHTVWNTLRYRMPSILYAIHYGTECQAYYMHTLRYKMPRIPYAINYDRECQA